MAWTLEHASVEQSLKQWGITAAMLDLPAMQAGSLTARIAGPTTDDILWAFKDGVILRRDSEVIFRGVSMPVLRSGDGNGEFITSLFKDPWWWLGQGAYTQAVWDAATSEARQAASVAMFAAIDAGTGWSVLSIGGQIAAIIAHCDALHGGGKMQIGTLDGDGFALAPTPQRLENATHEGALLRALQYVPDALPQWDHSTSPPTLNIRQRGSATTRSYSFADGTVQLGQEIKQRQDMAVTGVRILYRTLDALGNASAIIDQAGATSGSGVVEVEVDLTGGIATAAAPNVQPAVKQKYSVESETLDDIGTAAWWFANGDTGAEDVGNIIVASSSKVGGFSRLYKGGAMPASVAADHVATATITGALYVYFGPHTFPDGHQEAHTEKRLITLKVPTTDLTGDYELLVKDAVVSAPTSEASLAAFAPAGIAAQLLAAWSQAQQEGSFRVVGTECTEAVRPGDNVNITGGRAEWSTMAAQVQRVGMDILRGITTVTLGVAAHLSLEEFVKMLRVMRIAPALDLDRQSQGLPSGDASDIENPELVTPATTISSVMLKKVIAEYSTPTHKQTVDAENATVANELLDNTAKSTVKPDLVKVENPTTSEKTEVQSTAIVVHDVSAEDKNESKANVSTITNSAGDKCEVKADQIVLTAADGGTLTLSAAGGGSITLTKDGKTTTLSLLSLLHNDGAGNLNTITEGGMTVENASSTGSYTAANASVETGTDSTTIDAASGVTVQSGSNTGTLDSSQMQILIGSDSVTVSPEGGLDASADGKTAQFSPAGGLNHEDSGQVAQLSAAAGLHLEASAGITNVVAIAGETIELQSTDVCDTGGTEPVTQTAYFLRGTPA